MVALEYIWTLHTVIFSFISKILRFFLIFIVVRKQQLQYHTQFSMIVRIKKVTMLQTYQISLN